MLQFTGISLPVPEPKVRLSSPLIQDLFVPHYSLEGSNTREKEEEAFFNWVTFLSEFDQCKEVVIEEEPGTTRFFVTLEDLLIFVTGASEIPIMGFVPPPNIHFMEMGKYPQASTCTNTLTLPLGLSDYDQFRYNFAFGIANGPGFLRV